MKYPREGLLTKDSKNQFVFRILTHENLNRIKKTDGVFFCG